MRKHCALQQLPASLEARIASLTRMEHVVLEWVEKGKRNSEIAIILGRSERTIDCHVAAILHKLGVETRSAAGCALRDSQVDGSRDRRQLDGINSGPSQKAASW